MVSFNADNECGKVSADSLNTLLRVYKILLNGGLVPSLGRSFEKSTKEGVDEFTLIFGKENKVVNTDEEVLVNNFTDMCDNLYISIGENIMMLEPIKLSNGKWSTGIHLEDLSEYVLKELFEFFLSTDRKVCIMDGINTVIEGSYWCVDSCISLDYMDIKRLFLRPVERE